jgi:hypothetical protein
MKKNSNNTLHIFLQLVALFSIDSTNCCTCNRTSPVSVKLWKRQQYSCFQLCFTNEKIEEYEITVTESNNNILIPKIKGKELCVNFNFVNNGSEEDVSSKFPLKCKFQK